ncbi:MAG: type II secretion system protein [Patescibacteria group bacterium]
MKNQQFSIFNFRLKKGFSLVEMIVSMGIFSIVAVVALGAMAKIISANRKAQALQSSITNLNFALDSMSREMGTGINFNCSLGSPLPLYDPDNEITKSSCPSGYSSGDNSYIAFNNVSKVSTKGGKPCNLIYVYKFSGSSGVYKIEKAKQSDCNDNNPAFWDIVDPNVTIKDYYISVVDVGSNSYPLITIRVSGYAGVREKERSYFDVQTAVSPRQK